ncbi:unnamed protein product [Bursaphelenchus xylophilus]|uniref:(pine wood nematode) hypothetical protein n=1 Tax=Bursaphelenchus xylophilus TaxID=6326 RepID=A0A1I7S1G4_BURXY|nr:unnamed protein product [Bursaphelenchus xylophilus]CAG9081549.1 unnamed protein product [Bursaphelenchus xylophilus]
MASTSSTSTPGTATTRMSTCSIMRNTITTKDVVSTPQERQEARDRRFGAAGRMASSSSTDDLVHTDLVENQEKFNRSEINEEDWNNSVAQTQNRPEADFIAH